jgi:hypothetical protein
MEPISRRTAVLLVLVLISGALMSGCVTLDMHVQVFADGTGQSEVKFLVNTALSEMAKDTSWVDTMRANAEKNGFSTRTLKEGNLVGFGAVSKRLPLDQLPALQEGKSGTMQGLKVEKLFFSTRYTLDTHMDLTAASGAGNLSLPGNALAAAFLSQVDMKFRVTLPVKATTSNASSVSSDGKALTWNLLLGKSNPIRAEATVPNIGNIALVAGLGLVVAIMVVSTASRRNVRPHDTNGQS